RAKAAAFMIAVYAQANTAGDAKKMATLRDTALKVLKAVDEGNVKEASALAANLTPTPKEDPAAKTEPVMLAKQFEFEQLMNQFSSERIGGFGIEKELESLLESKDALTPPQMEKLTSLGYKLSMVAHIVHAYKDDKNEGGMKTIKNWVNLSDQFHKA